MTYGIETRDAAGVAEIFGGRKLTRLIKTLHLAYDFSGDVSVAGFDDTIGAITFYPKFTLYFQEPTHPFAVTRKPYGTPMGDATWRITTSTGMLPTFAWNNSSKILTVTPAQYGGADRPDYILNMVHYK